MSKKKSNASGWNRTNVSVTSYDGASELTWQATRPDQGKPIIEQQRRSHWTTDAKFLLLGDNSVWFL
jgi:hypothetical protein